MMPVTPIVGVPIMRMSSVIPGRIRIITVMRIISTTTITAGRVTIIGMVVIHVNREPHRCPGMVPVISNRELEK
jgi:hypothetical protein